MHIDRLRATEQELVEDASRLEEMLDRERQQHARDLQVVNQQELSTLKQRVSQPLSNSRVLSLKSYIFLTVQVNDLTSDLERVQISERYYTETCDELQGTVTHLRQKLLDAANVSTSSTTEELADLHTQVAALNEEKVHIRAT